MTKPQVGVVTSVGEMHLAKLGALENIKKAKAELLESLPSDGVAILNYDDVNVRKISRKFSGKKIWYGFSPEAELSEFQIKDLKSKLLGEKSKYALLAAYVAGQVFGIPKRRCLKVLGGLKPWKGRLNLLPGRNGVSIVDDTYNAGPQSTREALEVLRELPAQRRIAVLGDMLELGELEAKAHREVIRDALKVVDQCILIGPRYAKVAAKVGSVRVARDIQGAVRVLERLGLGRGDVVLVKGSQGMRMERVVEAFLKDKTKAPKLLVRQDPRWDTPENRV